jgi:hypothetical protein
MSALGIRLGAFATLLVVISAAPRVSAAQEVALRRSIPPASPGGCPAGTPPSADRTATAVDTQEAARLTTAASHAAILGDHDAARELLVRASRLDAGAENVAYLLARTLEELGEVEAAVAEYCRYLQLATDAPDAQEIERHVRRIAPPVRPGIPESAVSVFERALQLYDARRLVDAERAFSEVLEAAPGWADAFYNRGVVRAALDQRQPALADFQDYLALQPNGDAADRVRRWTDQLAVTPARYSASTAFVTGLVPGVGHFYTGRPITGLFFLAGAGGAIAFGILHETTRIECLTVPQDGVCPPDEIRGRVKERPYLVAAIAAAGAASLFSALDAARGARRKNVAPGAARLGATAGTERGIALAPPAVITDGTRLDFAWLRLRF